MPSTSKEWGLPSARVVTTEKIIKEIFDHRIHGKTRIDPETYESIKKKIKREMGEMPEYVNDKNTIKNHYDTWFANISSLYIVQPTDTDDMGVAEDGEGSGEKKKTKDYEIYISKPSKSVTANHPSVNILAVLATHPERENLRSESVDMLLESLDCHLVDIPEPTLWTMQVLIPALRQRLMPRFRETLPRKVRALRNRIERARNGGDDRTLYETLKQLRALALFCEEHHIPFPS